MTHVYWSITHGADFVCRDNALVEAGGVHLILTFYPEDESEYTQLLGRTCRQNDPGYIYIYVCMYVCVYSSWGGPAAKMVLGMYVCVYVHSVMQSRYAYVEAQVYVCIHNQNTINKYIKQFELSWAKSVEQNTVGPPLIIVIIIST
jgi:hypothetical protein